MAAATLCCCCVADAVAVAAVVVVHVAGPLGLRKWPKNRGLWGLHKGLDGDAKWTSYVK